LRLVTFRDGDDTRVGEVHGKRIRVLTAPTMIAWLAGEGRLQTRVEHALDGLELLAPIPDHPSVRDFFAFEEHVKTAFSLRGAEVPEAWYEELELGPLVGDRFLQPGDTVALEAGALGRLENRVV